MARVSPIPAGDLANSIAQWTKELTIGDIPPAVRARAGLLLADSIGCALSARRSNLVSKAKALSTFYGTGAQCSIWGAPDRTSLQSAVMANGVALRALDWNDIYWGTSQGGHPSDILPLAIAMAETEASNGSSFITAMVIGYELYCRLLDQIDPAGFVDHTTAGILAASAIVSRLKGFDLEMTSSALRLAAVSGVVPSVWRKGSIANGKAFAPAVAIQSGLLAATMAAQGVQGPMRAIEDAAGLRAALRPDADLTALLPNANGALKLSTVATKAFPCIGTAQAAISAALSARAHMSGADGIRAVHLQLSDLPATRVHRSEVYRRPTTHETADHSLYFVLAVALLEGDVTPASFTHAKWARPDIISLMDRITIELSLEKPRSPVNMPARLTLSTDELSTPVIVDCAASPGSPESGDHGRSVVSKLRFGLGTDDLEQAQAIFGTAIALTECNDIAKFMQGVGEMANAKH